MIEIGGYGNKRTFGVKNDALIYFEFQKWKF